MRGATASLGLLLLLGLLVGFEGDGSHGTHPSTYSTAGALRPPDTVRVAALRRWPPYYRWRDDGEPTGFAVETFRQIADRAGLTPRFHRFSTFPEAIEAFRAGEVDVIPNLGDVAHRHEWATFTGPVQTFPVVFFTRESGPSLTELSELTTRTVGVVRENVGAEVLAARPSASREVYRNAEALLFALLAGEVDAVIYPRPVLLALAREIGVAGEIRASDTPIREVKRAIAVAPDRPGLRTRLDSAVSGYVGSPAYEREYRQWFGDPTPFWTVERVVWTAAGVVLLAVILLAGWRYRSVRRLNRRLQESERRYRRIVEHNVAGIYRSEPEGVILDCNPAFAEMFGFESPGEAIGTPGDEFFPSPEERRQNNRKLLEDGELRNLEVRLRRRDGTPIWALANALLVDDADRDGPVIHGTMIDITERKQAQERHRRLFQQSVAAVFRSEHEAPGRILDCNEAFAKMFGFESRDEAVGSPSVELYPKEADRTGAMKEIREGGRTFQEAFEMRRRDGRSVWVIGETRRVEDPELGAVNEGVLFDVSDRVEAQQQLAEREEQFRQMAESIEEVFWLRDPDNDEVLYVSPAYEDIWERPVEEIYESPQQWIEAIHREDRTRMAQTVLGEGAAGFDAEYRIVRPDGEVRWIRDQAFPVRDDEGTTYRVAGVARDITERRELEEQLRHQALHDPLTGLANRSLLSDRVEQGLSRAERHGGALGLLMLDVDHFKRVNDRLGHAAGDRVLTELARRLGEVVREEDTVARWGGDEFAVVLPELDRPEGVLEVRERIYETVQEPIEAGGEAIHVDLSIGAVVHSTGDHLRAVRTEDPGDLLRFGSLALHWAKEEAPRGFRVFDPEEEIEGTVQIRRERELREGLERDEFVPYYQPIVRLEDGSLVDVEVLARWRHPDRGFVPPSEFIPLAEELGLITALEQSVVRQACRTVAEWERSQSGAAPLRIGFNLSAQQFGDREMAPSLKRVVVEEGLEPEQVTLEVTETSLMRVPARIEELRELGFRVSVDDFGTGYSTFTYLRDLEVDELKVDTTFVQGIAGSKSDAALVETMLDLGSRLGLEVIAEGIETEEQRTKLEALGCTLGQGFLFARPMPGDELCSQWLSEQARRSDRS